MIASVLWAQKQQLSWQKCVGEVAVQALKRHQEGAGVEQEVEEEKEKKILQIVEIAFKE